MANRQRTSTAPAGAIVPMTESERCEAAERVIEALRATEGFDSKHISERVCISQIKVKAELQWLPTTQWIARYLRRDEIAAWHALVRKAANEKCLDARRAKLHEQGCRLGIEDAAGIIATTLAAYDTGGRITVGCDADGLLEACALAGYVLRIDGEHVYHRRTGGDGDGDWRATIGVERDLLMEALAGIAQYNDGGRMRPFRLRGHLEGRLLRCAAARNPTPDAERTEHPVAERVRDWAAANADKALALTLAEVLDASEAQDRYARGVSASHAAGEAAKAGLRRAWWKYDRTRVRTGGNPVKRWQSPAYQRGERRRPIPLRAFLGARRRAG